MRTKAYIAALEESNKLPELITPYSNPTPEQRYNPRESAFHAIKKMARLDETLFHDEVAEILQWSPRDDA